MHFYALLLHLLQDLGLEVSDSKLVLPSTCVTYLGIQVDTIHRTISIPYEKNYKILKAYVDHGQVKEIALSSIYNLYLAQFCILQSV